jgi:hypothetical protein
MTVENDGEGTSAPLPADRRWRTLDLPLYVLLPAYAALAVAALLVAGLTGGVGVLLPAAVVVGGVAVVLWWSPRPTGTAMPAERTPPPES